MPSEEHGLDQEAEADEDTEIDKQRDDAERGKPRDLSGRRLAAREHGFELRLDDALDMPGDAISEVAARALGPGQREVARAIAEFQLVQVLGSHVLELLLAEIADRYYV